MDNSIKVYNKNMELLAVFSDDGDGLSPEAMADKMVAPTVHLESNNIPTFSFQMLADSPKWNDIKDPLNLYLVDGIWFTPLSDNSYVYTAEEGEVSVVNVTCLGIESLLAYQYHQIYNVNPYVYATKARFNRFINGDAEFLIYSYNCTNPGNTISSENCWNAVKQWKRTDDNGNKISYAILTADEYKPTGWEDVPTGVFLKSLTVSGNTATMVVESRTKVKTSKVFEYNAGGTYKLDVSPLPNSIEEVKINSTVITTSKDGKSSTYTTSEKTINYYSYNNYTGIVTLNYTPASTEQINGVTITYTKNDFGKISSNATCSFAAGAEAVDIHSVVLLPKSSIRNKLVIDNEVYEDSQVRDSRGVIMPRGSAGYAMWAVLRNTGWTLGICDVIAKGYDASIDYGCFNVETDMKDTLSNIRTINELYGGILVFDNAHKILHYRAENSTDYDSYTDGFNEWNGCVFREGKNLEEPPVVTYDNKIITRAYLLGYGNLNVAKVNNNKQYVENFSFTSDVYEGYLSQPLIYDTRDEGGQRQLLYWGKKELARMCKPRKTVTLSVTDLRYLPEYSFEIFDVNSIAKVYYHDSQTGENVIEEQRVILREYNPLALWDSTVELGDKTRNQVDIFKLIYKKTNNMPGVNGDGNIPGSNVEMVPDTDPNSFPAYIQLIARTTTQNSDAIAGIILDTGVDHATLDLFAQYQKQLDGLFVKTYSGLTFYADEKVAGLQEYVNAEWKKLNANIEATYVKKVELTEKLSSITEGINQKWETNETKVQANYDKIVTLTEDFSTLSEILSQDWEDLNDDEKKKIHATVGLVEEVTKDYALKTDFANYYKKDEVNNEISASKTSITQYVDGEIGKITLSAATFERGWVRNAITGEWEYKDYNGIRFTVGSGGVYVDNVLYPDEAFTNTDVPLDFFTPTEVKTFVQIGKGWVYTDEWGNPSLKFDGNKIAAQTVMASAIKGGALGLFDEDENLAGLFSVQDASSYNGKKTDISSPALSLYAQYGDLYLESTNGQVQVKAFGGNLELEGYNIVITGAGNVYPGYRVEPSLGLPSNPFTILYAYNDVSVVSDIKKKNEIDYDVSEYLTMFDNLKPCSYKLNNGTSGRKHIGLIANDVEEILDECGIDSKDFAGFIKSPNEETGSYDYSLRYGEFIGLCIAKIQQQDKELKELRAMIEGA